LKYARDDTASAELGGQLILQAFDYAASLGFDITNHVDDVSSIQPPFSIVEGSYLCVSVLGWYQEAGTRSLRPLPFEEDQVRWIQPMSAV